VSAETRSVPVGFLTDVTLCIGCKACQVACKQWNGLPGAPEAASFSGQSYDNTLRLSGDCWRHVAFVESFDLASRQGRWLFLSDVCKHCEIAGCLEACPTRAIRRTEYGTVLVEDDVCNGCGYCVAACPFGVVGRSERDGGAHKCTFCVDRLAQAMAPACAKACPTEAIVFGDLETLRHRVKERVTVLHGRGELGARAYGDERQGGAHLGGLHALFVLTDQPEIFGLPENPARPARYLLGDALLSALFAAGVVAALAGWFATWPTG
jgi:formate dehydrogenase iron-sulfur subunit